MCYLYSSFFGALRIEMLTFLDVSSSPPRMIMTSVFIPLCIPFTDLCMLDHPCVPGMTFSLLISNLLNAHLNSVSFIGYFYGTAHRGDWL